MFLFLQPIQKEKELFVKTSFIIHIISDLLHLLHHLLLRINPNT